MRMRHASLTLLVIATTSAQAQDLGDGPPPQQALEASVGLGVSHASTYLGSDQQRTRALPVLMLRSREGWFAGTGGLGWRWMAQDSALSGGLRLGFDRGRDESDDAALRGLGDIKLRPELGAFASYRIAPFLSASAATSWGSGNDRKGLRLHTSLRAMLPLDDQQRLMATVGATWANQASQQSQFGITAAQSLRSSYALYTPRSGVRDVDLRLGYARSLRPDLIWQLNLGVQALQGDAAESPLTQKSTNTSLMSMLIYRW
jgi:outer membrane protein